MQIEHPVCCGIDVHKDTLTACLRRVDANGHVSKEGREFATTYTSLLALSDWLVEQHCPVVAMESTGVYWKPVYHVLAGTVEVFIGRLLLDSRVVDLPRSSNRIVVTLSSLKLFFFNGLKKALHFSDHVGA